MQNTSRIQGQPNAILKNFFIAGLPQENLQNKVP